MAYTHDISIKLDNNVLTGEIEFGTEAKIHIETTFEMEVFLMGKLQDLYEIINMIAAVADIDRIRFTKK